MKENLSQIFKENKSSVRDYLFSTIHKAQSDVDENSIAQFFSLFKALDSVYIVDARYNQITPLFKKDGSSNMQDIGKLKESLRDSVVWDQNGEYMSLPYISSDKGKPTVTVAKRIGDNKILVLDFNLMRLLEEMRYINGNHSNFFDFVTKFVYTTIGYSMTLFSLILTFYGVYNTIGYFLAKAHNASLFTIIFKSTIALTLGLAIFDLAKNLLEHEVYYKDRSTTEHGGVKLLIKFLTSIIIALSIESLMTVFKITLINYRDIIYAFLLIIAISILIFALSKFYRTFIARKYR